MTNSLMMAMVKGCVYLHSTLSVGIPQSKKTIFVHTDVLITDLMNDKGKG